MTKKPISPEVKEIMQSIDLDSTDNLSIFAILRRRIVAGFILILPIWITYLLVSFVFTVVRDASLWLIEAYLVSRWGEKVLLQWGVTAAELDSKGIKALPHEQQWYLSALAAFLTITALYIIGVLTSNYLGRKMVSALEALVYRLPMIKTIYSASKSVLDAFSGDAAKGFQRVALVPYPTNSCRTIGFVTRIIEDKPSGEEYCTVFVPTAPNPTTGFVFLVKRIDVIELDWTIEEAIKTVMSGGVLLTQDLPPLSTSLQMAQPASPTATAPTNT